MALGKEGYSMFIEPEFHYLTDTDNKSEVEQFVWDDYIRVLKDRKNMKTLDCFYTTLRVWRESSNYPSEFLNG